jgi:hypothetical protein
MKPLRRNRLGNERGGALVMVAISLVVLLGMAALAVDLTAGYAWRNEAQKIADSAALAGGSAFLDFPLAQVTPFARERAYDYALRHTIKNEPVDSSEVTVEVLLAEKKVRVWIQREDLPAWFAGVIGFDGIDVAAVAAAQAVDAGAARCLKPIALPDMWEERDTLQDVNRNRIWDPGEEWTYDPSVDEYERLANFETPMSGETGYGSEFRDGRNDLTQTSYTRDFGRRIQLKAADPQDPYNFSPGIFFPWRLPQDEDMAECTQGGGGGNDAGGAVYRQNICSCNNSKIDLGVPYDVEPGNMIGPTFQGISELLDQDPNVRWDPQLGPVRDIRTEDGQTVTVTATESPRVIKIALFQPGEIAGSGMQSITFNNFALMFLENMQSPQSPVTARFMYFPNGEAGSGPTDGSLVRYLRLVE